MLALQPRMLMQSAHQGSLQLCQSMCCLAPKGPNTIQVSRGSSVHTIRLLHASLCLPCWLSCCPKRRSVTLSRHRESLVGHRHFLRSFFLFFEVVSASAHGRVRGRWTVRTYCHFVCTVHQAATSFLTLLTKTHSHFPRYAVGVASVQSREVKGLFKSP